MEDGDIDVLLANDPVNLSHVDIERYVGHSPVLVFFGDGEPVRVESLLDTFGGLFTMVHVTEEVRANRLATATFHVSVSPEHNAQLRELLGYAETHPGVLAMDQLREGRRLRVMGNLPKPEGNRFCGPRPGKGQRKANRKDRWK